MLRPDDPWFPDEAIDEAEGLLDAVPELRQSVAAADEELGLRSLLEQPETFSHGWWREQASKSRRSSPRLRRSDAA